MSQVAEYKGRKYKLLWRGSTQFGERAKLAFFDGSKEFWVAANTLSGVRDNPSPVERVHGKGRRGSVVRCSECGGWKAPGDPCNEPCD